VLSALENKREAFQRYNDEHKRQRRTVDRWLAQFEQLDSRAMLAILDEHDIAWPGAIPTHELDRAERLRLPFEHRWSDHQEARVWARTILENHPTIAVDGSQIAPDPSYSVPVGAIQIGWFINRHRADDPYVKEIEFEVLPPDELQGDGSDDGSFAIQTVNQTRFVRECEKLGELMCSSDADERTLHFFDGSFIISFAGRIRAARANAYIQATEELLQTSADQRRPLVGFVDTSNSHDIVKLANILSQAGEVGGSRDILEFSDATLLHSVLPNWGDRTPFFICAREDALSMDGRVPFYKDVIFCYIHLNRNRPPARLELPRWLLEEGRAEEIVNLVRAECVVGSGYPYPIETADALAVISYQDRRRFYGLFQQFVADEGIEFTAAAKLGSKMARR